MFLLWWLSFERLEVWPEVFFSGVVVGCVEYGGDRRCFGSRPPCVPIYGGACEGRLWGSLGGLRPLRARYGLMFFLIYEGCGLSVVSGVTWRDYCWGYGGEAVYVWREGLHFDGCWQRGGCRCCDSCCGGGYCPSVGPALCEGGDVGDVSISVV